MAISQLARIVSVAVVVVGFYSPILMTVSLSLSRFVAQLVIRSCPTEWASSPRFYHMYLVWNIVMSTTGKPRIVNV